MKRKVAIVGIGQIPFRSRSPLSLEEMVGESVNAALADAGIDHRGLDGVVYGPAVDLMQGFFAPDKAVFSSSCGSLRPTLRNCTSGSTGVSTAILAYEQISSGLSDVLLVVCFEKMSENHAPQAVFNTVYDEVFYRGSGINVPIQCSLEAQRFLWRYGITEEQMALVAVKNKGNALQNPYAQLGGKITVEDVLQSPRLYGPLKRLDISPTSDGSCAIVMASADRVRDFRKPPVYVKGVGRWAESVWFTGRKNRELAFLNYAYAASGQAYEMAGIKRPSEEIGVAEIYDPFTFKELQHCEAMRLCAEGESGRFVASGVTQRDGRLPVNPSGGLLGEGNPIGAAGLSRVIWLTRQMRGEAGGCQVRDPRLGVACAWGGMYQYDAVMVLGNEQ